MKKVLLHTAVALALTAGGFGWIASAATAGPNVDRLSTCLADATSGKERKELAQWVFINMSTHPEMQGMSKITAAEREAADRRMADLSTRLLMDNCKTQAKLVVDTEGVAALSPAFELLGRLAIQELLSNAAVRASFTNYVKYLDKARFDSTFGAK